MKCFDVDFNLMREISVSLFVELMESIHEAIEWTFIKNNGYYLVGHILEHGWLYEYSFDLDSMMMLNVTISKVDELAPSQTCRLDFLEVLMDELLVWLYDEPSLRNLYDDYLSIQMEKDKLEASLNNADTKVPLLKGTLEEMYDDEVEDLLFDVLKTENNPMIHEILFYQPSLRQREERLERLALLLLEDELDDVALKREGITIHQGKYVHIHFFENPRYTCVCEAVDLELLKKLFY